MSNVTRPAAAVKRGADASDALPRASGREVLEIGKLLDRLQRTGPAGSFDAPASTGATTATDGAFVAQHATGESPDLPAPVASHVIRAAIHVHTHGPQTIGQLATGLGISQGWASRVVDEMERAGYLERRRDPDDRRVVRVSLVPAAVERVERAYQWRGDAVEAALEGLSPEERAAVHTFLARFVEASGTRG